MLGFSFVVGWLVCFCFCYFSVGVGCFVVVVCLFVFATSSSVSAPLHVHLLNYCSFSEEGGRENMSPSVEFIPKRFL